MKPGVILKKLIRCNTTNPPGNEFTSINYLKRLLNDAGIKTTILYKQPKRPNLIARIKGKNNSSPIMLYGHVDVVPAGNVMNWQYPPFEGKTGKGCIWGRGALDMKGGIAMMVSAVLKSVREKIKFPGDVILCFLSDEEVDGEYGAGYLVENHSNLFKDIHYAISEFGGFSFYLAHKKFYLIQVDEKQICRFDIVFQGNPGHGSFYNPSQAIYKMARFLNLLNTRSLPVHITEPTRLMFQSIAKKLTFPLNLVCSLVLCPFFSTIILKILGKNGKLLQPLFRNILNATILRGGDKINSIPAQVSIQCDGRILPGLDPEIFITEIKKLAGNDCHLNIIEKHLTGNTINLELFPTLKSILKKMDPEGTAVPFLLPGSTDARFFNQLGIQTYGFIPMDLPLEINFFNTIHAENERIPLKALEFGSHALFELLKIF